VTPLDVLDPRTLAASAALAGFVFSGVLWGALRDGDPIVGAPQWFVSAALTSVALMTNAMQDMVPEVLARVIANVALVAGSFLVWHGARLYNGRSSVTGVLALATIVAFVANVAFVAIWPSPAHRIAVTSFGLMCGSLLAGHELMRTKSRHLRYGVLFTAIPLFVFAAFMAFRTLNAIFGTQTSTSLAQNPVNVASHLIGNLVLLSTLAGLTIIVNATRAAKIKALAYSDQLTRVLSRRGFYSKVGSHADRPLDNGLLFVFDVDRFKAVNDAKGHETGDKVLKLLANTLKEQLPAHSLIARFGGDEFVALVRNIEAPEAIAERIRTAFSQRSASVLNATTLVGSQTLSKADVSIGWANCERLDEPHLSNALHQADRSMYETKVRRRQLPRA
jgi:diguanylate cyclase (GGDEF)-like protein